MLVGGGSPGFGCGWDRGWEDGGWVDWERMARRDANAFEGSVPVFMSRTEHVVGEEFG